MVLTRAAITGGDQAVQALGAGRVALGGMAQGVVDVVAVQLRLALLGDHVGVFFDAGPAPDGPASSIVDLTGKRPRLLREGAIPADELERVLEEPFDDAT